MSDHSNQRNEAQALIDKAAVVAKALIETQKVTADGTTKALADALREVFGEHETTGRFIDITRIPLICQSIVGIHARIESIESNLSWGVKIVVGAVILALIALIIKQ